MADSKVKLLSYWEIPQSRGYIKLDSYVNNEVVKEEIASNKQLKMHVSKNSLD